MTQNVPEPEGFPVQLVNDPPSDRLLLVALAGLIGGLLLCLGGMILLSAREVAVPDVLGITTGTLSGGIVGLLVRPGTRS